MKNNKFYLLASLLGLIITTLTVSSLVSAHQLSPNGNGQGQNFDSAKRQAFQEDHQAMVDAIENGDYNTWVELATQKERTCVNMTDVINQDNFDEFSQMHQLMQDGDFEAAQQIREELGLPERGMGMGAGMHRGFGRGGQNLSEPELQ